MKKVKNLEVNLKKLVAIGASILTIGTMAGCAKTEIKEEITQNPVATQPQEEPEVVVDPNAPLFDITDEEVFNQKVDELFNEINGLEFKVDNFSYIISKKEEAILFLKLLNYDSLNDSQKDISNFSDNSAYIWSCYINFGCAIVDLAVFGQKNLEISKYISDKENSEILRKAEIAINNYSKSNCIIEDDYSLFEDNFDDLANSINENSSRLFFNYFVEAITYELLHCSNINGDDNYDKLLKLYNDFSEKSGIPLSNRYDQLEIAVEIALHNQNIKQYQ